MAVGSKRAGGAVGGVGPGNGEALAPAFRRLTWKFYRADGATDGAYGQSSPGELPSAKVYACDVTEAASVEAAVRWLRASDLGEACGGRADL